MSKRLYVGNLAFTTSEAQLQTAFERFGATDVKLIVDQDGRSKGFAFVNVEADQMNAAITAMNNRDLNGRTLTVNEARPREERSGGGGGNRGGYGGGNRW
jgi:RNA recognition motif-containing protein